MIERFTLKDAVPVNEHAGPLDARKPRIRYAKALYGERVPVMDERQSGLDFFAIRVTGFVFQYAYYDAEPHLLRLQTANILCIDQPPGEVDWAALERRVAGSGFRVASIYPGEPEALWVKPPRRVSLYDVGRARRIIALRNDGTYRIIKNMDRADPFRPHDETILLFDGSAE